MLNTVLDGPLISNSAPPPTGWTPGGNEGVETLPAKAPCVWYNPCTYCNSCKPFPDTEVSGPSKDPKMVPDGAPQMKCFYKCCCGPNRCPCSPAACNAPLEPYKAPKMTPPKMMI